MVLGLMDVVALFPSIDQRKVAKVVAEEIIVSEVEYSGMDVWMAVWTMEARLAPSWSTLQNPRCCSGRLPLRLPHLTLHP